MHKIVVESVINITTSCHICHFRDGELSLGEESEFAQIHPNESMDEQKTKTNPMHAYREVRVQS